MLVVKRNQKPGVQIQIQQPRVAQRAPSGASRFALRASPALRAPQLPRAASRSTRLCRIAATASHTRGVLAVDPQKSSENWGRRLLELHVFAFSLHVLFVTHANWGQFGLLTARAVAQGHRPCLVCPSFAKSHVAYCQDHGACYGERPHTTPHLARGGGGLKRAC